MTPIEQENRMPGVVPSTVVIVGEPADGDLPPEAERLSPTVHVVWAADDTCTTRGVDRVVSLDGATIVGNRLVTDAADLLAASDGKDLGAVIRWWDAHARQAACAYVWDAVSRTMVVLPDPLGGATLFGHDVAGLTVLSSDYAALVAFLNRLGRPPVKELMYQVERTVFGNGGLWETSHRGGYRIPAFTHVRIDHDGVRQLPYSSSAVLTQPRSYLDSLNGTRADVLASVEAIASASTTERIAHLTGGFDSRLVLGAILEAGVAERFSFFCSGPPESADRKVADGLSRTFRLTRAHGAGLVPATVGSPPEQQLALLRYTAGLSAVGPTGLEESTDTVASGGGYGELLRSFYGATIPGEGTGPFADGRSLMAAILGDSSAEEILKPSALEALSGRLSATLVRIADRGVPADFVGDAFYTEVRNRYHMGATSLMWSRVGTRVNPLYSVHALGAAREVTKLARRANVPGYDLLESFGHRLSQYEFDTSRTSPEYRRQRRARPPVPFDDGPLVWAPRRAEGAAGGTPLSDERRRLVVERAEALGVQFWQSLHLEETQHALAAVLEAADLTEVRDYVSTDYLEGLVAGVQWNRRRVRHLYAALGMLQWYVG